jgi:hypothetical protein
LLGATVAVGTAVELTDGAGGGADWTAVSVGDGTGVGGLVGGSVMAVPAVVDVGLAPAVTDIVGVGVGVGVLVDGAAVVVVAVVVVAVAVAPEPPVRVVVVGVAVAVGVAVEVLVAVGEGVSVGVRVAVAVAVGVLVEPLPTDQAMGMLPPPLLGWPSIVRTVLYAPSGKEPEREA